MSERPKILYLLIGLWIIFSAIFIILGYYALDLVAYIASPASGWAIWYPMLFFGNLMITTILFVFGCIFLIFSYEIFKGKSWVWNAGVIISTIFIVIFSFVMGSLMITAIFFRDAFTVNTLIAVMLSFLVDLGIIFLITRPNIKSYMHD